MKQWPRLQQEKKNNMTGARAPYKAIREDGRVELRYVKDGKVLMVEDQYGNREILDKVLKKSFNKERIQPDQEEEESSEDERT